MKNYLFSEMAVMSGGEAGENIENLEEM